MTTSGFSDPACREFRQLLGVYVVGAIDPAERALVDEHLGQCQSCRDELAGLAGLPAMLSRVPAADVEWLGMAPGELPEIQEPSDELLTALLRKVAVRRRSRMWRSVAAVAAAAVIAAGGATAAVQLARQPAAGQVAHREVASAVSPGGQVSAVVDYSPTAWGTAMRVQVAGISPGTTCQFWVVGKNGRRSYAGTWTVTRAEAYGGNTWYAASSTVAAGSVHSFRITTAGGSKLVLNVPVPRDAQASQISRPARSGMPQWGHAL